MLYLLDKDVKTVKWNGIPLHEASSAIVKEEVNGDFVLTVRYPITDSGIYQLIKEDMLIKTPVPVLGAQLFRIKKPIENDDSLDITAYHISDDVMQRSINPLSVVGQGCAMALSQMVQNAKTDLGNFSFTSDIMDSRTFNTTETETLYTVLMDGKHSIVGTWEGELVRDNLALTVKRSRGADRGVVITTHKNLKSYQRTKNSQSVVTRIHAKSTFKAEGAEEETTINVTVDSPLIGNYPYINEKDYENNNAKTVDELRKWAEAKFKQEGIDKISDAIEIEAYELDGQVIHLGDTVNIKSRKHDVDIYKKAIAYEYNALTEEYISITFDDKPGVGGSGVSSGVSNAADVILGVNANAQEIAVERAIKNANQAFDAEFEKRVESINDGIEQAQAEAERYADQIKTEISQEFDAFEQEHHVIKQSQSQQIADILAKAQANTILATDAKNIGNQAKVDAANVLSKALQYKNEAITEATRLDTVERQATETKLATAKSQAISEATRLVETAKSLLSGQISNVSTDLSQTKEAIKLLATRATVEALTGRISSAESTLQVQAGEIASRVKTSDFDQAEQRISTAESSITQLGNRITTEISETVAKIPTEIGTNNLFILSGSTKGIYKSNLHQDVKSLRYAYGPKILIDSQATYTLQSWSNILNDFSWLGYSQLDSNGVQIPNTYVTIYPARLQKYYRRDIITHNSAKYIQFSFSDDVFGDTPNLKIKLEKGMIASDWSPAPEDAVAEIENVKTAITQTTYGQEQLSTKLTETQGKVTIAETNIRQLVNVVSSKVSQETFDNLKRTVDSQGTSISQNQSAIALKAEKTYVDGVKTTADSALSKANSNADSIRTTKAELKVTSDAVATKVSQSDFNAVDQRLTSAETTIRTQAGLIEQRLTSTQVDAAIVGKGYQTASQVNTAITSKGYQTKADVDKNITDRGYITNSALQPYVTSTVFENKVRETTDSFSRSITETKALIPTDFSGGNLIRNGAFPTIPWSGSRVATHSFYYNSQKTLFLLETASTTNEATSGSSYFKVKRNTDYTLSFIAFSASRVKSSDVWFLGRKTGETQGFTSTNILISSRKFSPSFAEYITATFNSGENDEAYIRFDNNGSTDGQMAAMFFGEVMLVEGNTARKWEACFDDLVTETKYNEVKDTVDSHTRTIGEQGNSLSQVIQTAQGLVTRVNNLKSGNRNYLLDSKATTINMTSVTDTGTWDTPINISADFWKHDDVYKNQKIRLSLYYQSSVTYSTSRTFPVHFRKSPWYQIGTITYPAGSTRPVKYEFTFGTMPSGFDASQIFIRFDRALDRGRVHTIERAQLEVSDMFSDWSPAPEDGDQAIQAVSTQVNTLAGSWAVKNLTSSGTVLNQLNLNKDGSIKIDGSLVQITGKTYIQDGIISAAKIGDLSAGKITSGYLDAARIRTGAIDGSKIAFDEAFFNGLTANQAYLKKLFAKDAFLTAVQAVSISASQITGGLMRATNGAMEIDFNNSAIDMFKDGAIRFHSGSNAIYRQSADGTHTAFVHFDTTSKGGIYASLGSTSSRDGINSKSSGRFAGIRVARTSERSDSHVASQDAVELYGDTIFFGHGFEGGGFSMHTTLTGGQTISLNKMHGALINLCRCWIHLRNEGFNLNSQAFRKSLDIEIHNAQQLYNTIERIT